jgi:DNA polymerase-1
MGPTALSGIIGVSVNEATKFIETFLGKFPTLHQYIQETISFGRTHKYVKTLFQRRRLLPDIQSGETQEKKRSERQALNSVIQGTAADVVPFTVFFL